LYQRSREILVYHHLMPETDPTTNEILQLANAVAAIDDVDVIDSAALLARLYRRERFVALGLAAVDSMLADGPEEIGEDDPRLVAVRKRLRDRLKELLRWARATGRK